MHAISPTWRSTHWMLEVWWRPLRAGWPGEERRARPIPYQTTRLRARLRRARAFSLLPIRRWPCLILSVLAGEVVVERVAAAVAAEVVAGLVVALVEAAAKVAPVEAVALAAELAAKVALVVARAVVVKAAPAEVAALAVAIPSPTTIIRPTISRGQSCRRSHLRPRPTSKSWPPWRKEPAVSRFSTPTTCSVGSNASAANKTSSTSWATCPATRRKEAATL